MSKSRAPASPAESLSDAKASGEPIGRARLISLISAGFVFLAWCIWIVHQGGVTPAEPGSAVSLAGLVLIVLESLPLLAAWWLGAAGYGYALRQRGVAQVGVGMAALLLLNYVAGLAIGFSGWIAWGLCLVGVVLFNVEMLRMRKQVANRGTGNAPLAGQLSWWWLLGIPGVAMLIVAACCPPGTIWRVEALGYDVLSYHLQIPKEWIAAGRMVELEHNVYAYLPGLMEAAFAALMSMRGGAVVESVYLCQLFHASFALLAAVAVASLLRGYVNPALASGGGALVLLVPWVIVTGSMAYNEMVVVAFAAVGLQIVAGQSNPCDRAGVAIGLLAGAATLAKLTGAFTVALPLGALLVWRLLNNRPWCGFRGVLIPTLLCVVVGFAALSPYLVRNAAWTGNPAFPFAGEALGHGHWDDARAARWDAAHMPDEPWGERFGAVWRQAIGNTGYGAWGGGETPTESKNIARFATEGGLPVLWIAAGLGVALGLTKRETRWLSAVLVCVVLGQFVWWLSMTHLQSRFLVVAIVPLCAGAGLLFGFLDKWKIGSSLTVGRLVAGGVAAVMAAVSLSTTWSQTTYLAAPDGQRPSAPLWFLVDGLPSPHGTDAMQDLPLNALPDGSTVMVVGNNQSLFYINRDMVYASAFDASPITAMLAISQDPDDLARRLRADGVTHLWLGYSELDRLHATYGFDDGVTSDRLERLVREWKHLSDPTGPTVLIEVPSR